MKENKIKQAEIREIKRSEINFAAYNPRNITEEARKALKANLKKIGLLGGVVWNEETGNLVSGHQRVSIMDDVNKYDPATNENDYVFRVEVAHLDEKTEKEQNLFMNNHKVQGEFDPEKLVLMLEDIDLGNTGFDDFDLDIMGIGSSDLDLSPVVPEKQWTKEEAINESAEAAIADAETYKTEEQKGLDRSVNFYEDTKENQVKRHNDVQAIKDRINNQNDIEKDGGMLSYVVLSFKSPMERANFMSNYGYAVGDRYIDGTEFMNRVEFGFEEEEE